MNLRIMETVRLEKEATNINPMPMTNELINKFVTARAEQIPNICLKTGLSLKTPREKIVFNFPNHFATPPGFLT